MRIMLVCSSLCLVAFTSVGDPQRSVGAVGALAPVSRKGDMEAKDQSRFQRDLMGSIPKLDWPVLLRDDLAHLNIFDTPSEDTQSEDARDSAAVEPGDDDAQHQASVDEVCTALAQAAQENHIPVAFFLRLIWQESRFDAHSVSRAGALGVAQFMPESAAEQGLQDPFDPIQALPASARMLSSLKARFGNLGLAAAAYNAGPKRIQDWLTRRARLPLETRNYVLKITGRSPELWKHAVQRPDLRVPDRAPCRDFVPPQPVQEASADPMSERAPAEKTAAHHGRHLIHLASAEVAESHKRHRR